MKKLTLDEYKALAATFVSNDDSEARIASHHSRIANAIKQWELLLTFDKKRCGNNTIPNTRSWLNRELGIEEAPRKVKVIVEPISTTKKLDFLGERMGENAPTKLTVRGAWSDEKHLDLLKKTVWCCADYDDDRLIECNAYAKLTIEVPSWMTHGEFDEITMCYYKHAGGSLEWSKSAYNRLNSIGFTDRYAVCKLVNSNPRTPKRQELKAIFLAWMEGADCLGYGDFDKIHNQYIELDAKRSETAAYYDR